MRLQDYPEKDGKRVWLSAAELETLIEDAVDVDERLAFALDGRVGLRRSEIVAVEYQDFLNADDGFVRVWGDYAKREKYREPLVPDELETIVETRAYDADRDEQVVDLSGSSVYRRLQKAAQRQYERTDDVGWTFLDVHDLRRSWGAHLLWNEAVLPSVVHAWGGWEDWETFEEHYLGEITPEAADRERQKVDYMSAASGEDADTVFEARGVSHT